MGGRASLWIFAYGSELATVGPLAASCLRCCLNPDCGRPVAVNIISASDASGECGVGTGRPKPLFLPRKRWLIRGCSLSAPEPAEQPHCEAGLVPVPPRLSLRLGDTKPSRFVGWNQGSPTCRTGAWRKHPTSDETRSLTRSAGCPSGASGRSGRFERLHHSHRRDRQAFGQPSGKNPSQSSNLGQLPGCGEAGRSL